MNNKNLPLTIETGKWRGGHIQGIAMDREKGYIYCSFTTELVKLDLCGNVIGSVKGFTGHLGCLAMGPDGRIYGSLEYKNDSIGRDILNLLGIENEIKNAFYIAVFDGDKIDSLDMDAEKGGIMKTVWLKEPTEDYLYETAEKKHRYACSGIDGITFAPAFEGEGTRVYVAYGIYGDNTRDDNDYQVLLCYDPKELVKYEAILAADNIHSSGPEKAENRYFVYTGNTTFGVQNMEYDESTGNIFMAVYRGRKEKFKNHNLFLVDTSKGVRTELLKGMDGEYGKVLSLAESNIYEEEHGIYSYEFKYGSTGMISLGGGYFYISEPRQADGEYESTIRLYKLTGKGFPAFAAVTEE